ncbi:MAG: anti-sigma factor [Gloeobacterales cyanobacterium]
MDIQPLEMWEELVAGYILEDLSLEEKKAFDQLLQERPELVAAEIRRLKETLALTPYALPETIPSPRLRNQLLVAAQQQTSPVIDLSTVASRRSPAWIPWAGSVASVIALLFGLDSYRLRQELQTTQEQLAQQQSIVSMLQQANTHLVTFRASAPSSEASGNLIVTPSDKDAVLVLKNLAPVPKEQVYRLWAVVNGKKFPCGQFTPDPKGTVFLKLPMEDALMKSPLVVTLEPSLSPSTSAEGPMVMTTDI